MQIAMLTSNMGAEYSTYVPHPSCEHGGDQAKLQVNKSCGLETTAKFMRLPAKGAGNFEGRAEDVLGCLLRLGNQGCVFSQPLFSFKIAKAARYLDEFIRKDAHLLIVIVDDVDDCSAGSHSPLFYYQNGPSQTLRFRCAFRGHVCDNRSLTATVQSWPLTECREEWIPRPEYLFATRDMVKEIKAIKAAPARVLAVAFAGWPPDPATARYSISLHPAGVLQLDPVCSSAHGPAQPPLRLKAFVEGFAEDGLLATICTDDWHPEMRRVGRFVRDRLRQ
jgi:hypothetical protein